jgi:hypothetical protein
MGGGGKKSTIRYAPYIEHHHALFLQLSQDIMLEIYEDSPYASFVRLDFDDALFSAGNTMSSFPSLYDMYGKFMGGIDIESLYEQVLHDVQNTQTIRNVSNAHNDLLVDDYEQKILPRFQAGMRDMNSVLSSTFIIGQSVLEANRAHDIAKFDADLQYKLIPVASEVFKEHLTWNQNVVGSYLQVMKFASMLKMDTDAHNYEYLVKDKLWPYTVLEQHRANLGALQGARASSVGEVSKGQKALGGAMSGAALGAQVGGGYGAVIGGVIGGIAGYFM